MSRYNDWDDYEGDPEQVLARGRWERNARATLKSRRGRKALAGLREALLALPEKRLIASAVCTVGGADKRVPAMTGEEVAAKASEYAAADADAGHVLGAEWATRCAECEREDRERDRRRLAEIIDGEGEGVCAIGAFLWHQKVRGGMDPAAAFAGVPTVFGAAGDGDPLNATARLGEQAGLAFTLAWELAYRNDETYGRMTPEERYTAFLEWIDAELGEPAEAGSADAG